MFYIRNRVLVWFHHSHVSACHWNEKTAVKANPAFTVKAKSAIGKQSEGDDRLSKSFSVIKMRTQTIAAIVIYIAGMRVHEPFRNYFGLHQGCFKFFYKPCGRFVDVYPDALCPHSEGPVLLLAFRPKVSRVEEYFCSRQMRSFTKFMVSVRK